MNIILNSASETPIYTQIYAQISTQIICGEIKAGEKLPGIRQIANELRISVIPVKMAWEELDKNGFIKTVSGSGTFVNELQSHEIESKLNEKAAALAERTCKEAKENGIPIELVIKLLSGS